MSSCAMPDASNAEIRCFSCRKLLLKVGENGAFYETKCQRCGRLNAVSNVPMSDIVIVDRDGDVLYTNCQLKKTPEHSLRGTLGDMFQVCGLVKEESFYTDILARLKQEGPPAAMSIRGVGPVHNIELIIAPVLNAESMIQFIVFEVRRTVHNR